jgi:hypothetical protein
MSGVENLYKMRVQAGTWQPALDKQQVFKIAALTTKIDDLQNAKGGKGKGKNKIIRNDKNAWKFVVARDGETKEKEFEG